MANNFRIKHSTGYITIYINSWNGIFFSGSYPDSNGTIMTTHYDIHYIQKYIPEFVEQYPEFFI